MINIQLSRKKVTILSKHLEEISKNSIPFSIIIMFGRKFGVNSAETTIVSRFTTELEE